MWQILWTGPKSFGNIWFSLLVFLVRRKVDITSKQDYHTYLKLKLWDLTKLLALHLYLSVCKCDHAPSGIFALLPRRCDKETSTPHSHWPRYSIHPHIHCIRVGRILYTSLSIWVFQEDSLNKCHTLQERKENTLLFFFLPEGREIIVQNKTNKVLICQMNVVKLMAKKQTYKQTKNRCECSCLFTSPSLEEEKPCAVSLIPTCMVTLYVSQATW